LPDQIILHKVISKALGDFQTGKIKF